MKLRSFALVLFSLTGFAAGAQQLQLYDNTNYKAIYFKQACDLIAGTPNLVLLDVRSPGEYADTSRFISSRIGRLKGAINISIDSVEKHFKDLLAFKGRPILVYCSHSQRSRRVSKFLADTGFTNIYSLNGGMTEVDREAAASFPCKESLYETAVPYKLMGPDDAASFIKDKNNVVIDVRTAAEFNGADTTEGLNIGRIKGAVNVPLGTLDGRLSSIEKYKNSPVLVYALSASESMTAAQKLTAAGFKNVAVLFNGLDVFLANFPSSSKVRRELITAAPAYHITGVREAVDLVNNTPALVVADMRARDEFANKAKFGFHNLGHIKNAVNFTDDGQLETYLKDKPKNTPVLVYTGFSASSTSMMGMHQADVAALCKKLTAEGYTNVYLLYDGIYSVVWAAANVDGLQDAKTILADHQGLY